MTNKSTRPRRFHVYGIGAAKTGTHSLAAMFASRFRSAHEPESEMVEAMTRRLGQGLLTQAQFEHWLLARDERLGLEMDVSWLNGRMAVTLARMFEASRFVLTVREPLGWLNSMINQHRVLGNGQHWRQAWLTAFGPLPERYPPEEVAMARQGLHPVSVYLRYWSTRNLTLIDQLPVDRLMVLKVRQLRARADELAAFCGTRPGQLNLSRAHEFKGAGKARVLAELDDRYLRREIIQEGRPLLQRCFPGLLSQLEASSP